MKLKRLTLVIPFFVLAVTPFAYAGGEWDHSGGTVGRFGSAEAACKDLIGTGGAYEFASVSAPNANGYADCFEKAKDKGNSKETPAPIKKGVVYKVDKPQPAPSSTGGATPKGAPPTTANTSNANASALKEGCDASMIQGWFPTWKGSRIEAAGAGIESYPEIGKCESDTSAKGPRMFVNSKGTVRPDRYLKPTDSSGRNHWHLRVGELIVDTTIFQFFQRKGGFKGFVFVGTEDQLKTTLEKLVTLCGINQEKDETLDKTQSSTSRGTRYKLQSLFGQSGESLKKILYDNAIPKERGACLKMRASGLNADYLGNCSDSAQSGKTLP